MKRSTLVSSIAACACLGLVNSLPAAEPPEVSAATPASSPEKSVSAAKPAAKCLSDLHAFDSQMEKDGYWLSGSGYGYGYPMGGFGYEPSFAKADDSSAVANGYRNARPGYEVRILVASANILARHGQQQACESVLDTTRSVYKLYMADLRSGKVPVADIPDWRRKQIAAAQPVTNKDVAFRSDELLGTEVRDPQNQGLGSVDDLVMNSKGKIAYLVISRGGLFGIDEKYVPVPWANFKIAPNMNLLVLDATKGTMDAAPRVNNGQFTTAGRTDQESQKVDGYWKDHLTTKAGN